MRRGTGPRRTAMAEWVWVEAAVAVAFVLWAGVVRGWWRGVRYSWSRAAHVVEVMERGYAAPEYGSMILAEERALHHEWERERPPGWWLTWPDPPPVPD